MRRKKVKAVYTIEAAILIPFILSIMAFSIHLAVDLYTEVHAEASSYEAVSDLDEVKTVHKMRSVGNFWREISED